MIARTVIQLESSDGTVCSRWSYQYDDRPDDGASSFAMAQCLFLSNAQLASHVMCVSVINSLTAIARWGDR